MSDEDLTNFEPDGQPDVDESRSDYRARVEAARAAMEDRR